MGQAYRYRVTRNGVVNGQHLSDDMEIRMQSKNGMNPMSNQAGREEIIRRFETQYGVDMGKAGLNLSNIREERIWP